MKWILTLGLVLNTSYALEQTFDCKETIAYFDLGDTVVDTKGGSFKNMDYVRGVKEYIKALKINGCRIGLITNIPETFGISCQKKFSTLKDLISDGWRSGSSFDWSEFDVVYFPNKDIARKPNPGIFVLANDESIQGSNVNSFFQGENRREVSIASEKIGMKSFQIKTQGQNPFLPITEVKNHIEGEQDFVDTSGHRIVKNGYCRLENSDLLK